MKSVLKIGAFLIVLVALIGGGIYVNQNSKSSVSDDSNFNKAIEIMQNLQSAAIGGALTNDQLTILENGYNDANVRLPKIRAFRETDKTNLVTIFTNNNITGTIATDISTLSTSLVDSYKTGIDAKLAALDVTDAVKASIRKLTDSINSLSNDIRLTTQFINWYGTKRPNICITTDPSNNQYVAGTITFKYPSNPAKTPVTETCNGATLSEHFCSGLEYTVDATHDNTFYQVE